MCNDNLNGMAVTLEHISEVLSMFYVSVASRVWEDLHVLPALRHEEGHARMLPHVLRVALLFAPQLCLKVVDLNQTLKEWNG